jgi:hypothetical protein
VLQPHALEGERFGLTHTIGAGAGRGLARLSSAFSAAADGAPPNGDGPAGVGGGAPRTRCRSRSAR